MLHYMTASCELQAVIKRASMIENSINTIFKKKSHQRFQVILVRQLRYQTRMRFVELRQACRFLVLSVDEHLGRLKLNVMAVLYQYNSWLKHT
jgi:hypothetical protein